MGVTNVHSHYAVALQTDDMGSALLLGGITEQAIETGTEVRQITTSNEVFARFQSLVAQKPMARFTTLNLASALATIGLLGKAITAVTNAGLTLFAQKFAEGGTRSGTGAHKSYNFQEGLIVPRSLTCDHQGDAKLQYEVLVTYDGTNAPILISESVTLPSGLTDAERFTLGPVTIGDIALDHKISLQIDFGLRAETIGADSEIHDTFASIRAVQPTITLKGIDPGWFAAAKIPLLGKVAAHNNTEIILRKRGAGGTFVAAATAEHILITASGLAYCDPAFEASTNEDGTTTLVLPLNYDGTNYPLVIDETYAYE